VLAIDHGSARCGTAISDPTGTISRPLEPISPPDPEAVATLAREHGAERIVVGLPVSLDGTEGAQAAVARDFAAAVADSADVPVETWDERLTTRMAAQSRREGSRAAEDSLAAAHLLDSYLLASEARR
jgi:putative Holliday junction resolvase